MSFLVGPTCPAREVQWKPAAPPWQGGRDGHIVCEDDWNLDRSWSYYKRVLPICGHNGDSSRWECSKCKESFRVYLKLHINGSIKGRLVPTYARARLGFSYERYRGQDIDLGKISVNSLRKAKAWASKLATPEAIKVLLQTYYQTFEVISSKKGKVIEAQVEGFGWVEWFWSFEEHLDWRDLLKYHRILRYRSTDQDSYTVVHGNSFGYTSNSWPSFWQRIRARGVGVDRLTDEYGPL